MESPKQLVISTVTALEPPDPIGKTKLLLEFHGQFIGALSLPQDDFADFLQALRGGFPDVVVKPIARK